MEPRVLSQGSFEKSYKVIAGKHLGNCNILCCSPEFDLGSFATSFEKAISLISGQEVNACVCVLSYCLSVIGCMFHPVPQCLYLIAQFLLSKTTLLPSMSAHGCSSVVSLIPSPKLSSVTDTFLMPDDLKAG